MKIGSIVVATAAALALVVQGATAAEVQGTGHRATSHGGLTAHPSSTGHLSKPAKSTKLIRSSTSKASGPAESSGEIYVAPFSLVPVVTPRYIYWPAPTNVVPVSATDECVTSGSNCSDEQLCDIWGMNCPAAGFPAPASDSQGLGTSQR